MMPFAVPFTAPQIQWMYLTPILVVLGAGVLAVLVEAFVPVAVRRGVQVLLALAATAASFGCVVWLWQDDYLHTNGVFVVRDIGGTGAIVLIPSSLAIQGLVVLLAFVSVLFMADRTATGKDAFAPAAAAVPGSAYELQATRRGLEQTEVFPLVLFATGGMLILPTAANLLVMFVALEVVSLPLYVLTAMARRRRLLSQEAALKYFLLGAFASALFLFGSALLYGYAKSVDLRVIAQNVLVVFQSGGTLSSAQSAYILTGALLVLVGLLFKIGAVPFHAWVPDVYQGAPTPVTAFMAACTKVAAFGALIQVVMYLGVGLWGTPHRVLFTGMWIVAIATMAIGTLVAVVQTDVKRMLAYSSIAHVGFILVALATVPDPATFVTADDAAKLEAGVGPTIFYLAAYGAATIGAFAVTFLVRERSATVREAATRELLAVGAAVSDAQSGRPVMAPVETPTPAATATSSGSANVGDGEVAGDAGAAPDGGRDTDWTQEAGDETADVLGEASHLSQWAGLGRRSPWLAGAFALFLLSMAGIPLTAGFIAKFQVFKVAVLLHAAPLAIIGVLASAIAVFFYARIIVLMFFTPPGDGDTAAVTVRSRGPIAVVIALCAIAVIVLGVWPAPVLNLLS